MQGHFVTARVRPFDATSDREFAPAWILASDERVAVISPAQVN
jgi:hypothetical protein